MVSSNLICYRLNPQMDETRQKIGKKYVTTPFGISGILLTEVQSHVITFCQNRFGQSGSCPNFKVPKNISVGCVK